jgi:hypothetical protein
MNAFVVEESPDRVEMIAFEDELAKDLGYQSACQMMEQTEVVPLPSGAYVHLTTDSDGYWVAWRERAHYDIRRFDSRDAALAELRRSENLILMQS